MATFYKPTSPLTSPSVLISILARQVMQRSHDINQIHAFVGPWSGFSIYPVKLGEVMAKYEEVCCILRDGGFEEDVVDVFKRNRIDIEVFQVLEKEDFRELGITTFGDMKRLLMLKKNIIYSYSL